MRLYKALKLRKNLIGEIADLKRQIKDKNSYLEGSKNGEKFNVNEKYNKLLELIDELTALKFIINEANREIQSRIYALGEYKALVAFWKEVPVTEGTQIIGYSDKAQNYVVQIDEEERNNIISIFQKRIDAIQEELDEYNFNTEIPWGDMSEDELQTLENSINEKQNTNNCSGNCNCHPVDTKK
jgi:hypothetical protein